MGNYAANRMTQLQVTSGDLESHFSSY